MSKMQLNDFVNNNNSLDYFDSTNNLTPLMESIAMKDYELQKAMLDYGADPEYCICDDNTAFKYTAAHIAIENNDVKAFNILIDYGLDASIKTKSNKQNLAHYAARENPEFLYNLYSLGIDFDEADQYGDNVWDLLRSKSPEKISEIKQYIKNMDDKKDLTHDLNQKMKNKNKIL